MAAAVRSVDAARALVGRRASRELVPTTAGASARWHTHDYPGEWCRWNYHPEYEVHLIQHGVGRAIVGDYIGPFAPGHLVLVGSNLPHHWISDVPDGQTIVDRDVVFQFHPRWIADAQAVMPELRVLDQLLTRAARGIEFDGEAAVAAAEQLVAIGASSGLQRLQHVLGMLAVMADAPPEQTRLLASPWTPPLHAEGTSDFVDATLAYVFTHLADDVRMSEAAALAGLSEAGFSRAFRRSTGQSFSDTVRKLRLAHACQLLEHSDEPIARISQRVGYANLSNFNRQFQRVHTCTPTQYRRAAGATASR